MNLHALCVSLGGFTLEMDLILLFTGIAPLNTNQTPMYYIYVWPKNKSNIVFKPILP